jgi:hypothetical protein
MLFCPFLLAPTARSLYSFSCIVASLSCTPAVCVHSTKHDLTKSTSISLPKSQLPLSINRRTHHSLISLQCVHKHVAGAASYYTDDYDEKRLVK